MCDCDACQGYSSEGSDYWAELYGDPLSVVDWVTSVTLKNADNHTNPWLPFGDYFELRDRVAEYEADFAHGFTEALIEYGLGRPYGFTDYDLAETILTKARSSKFNTRTFIHTLVQSEQFRQK